jgi:uncharacterized phiE125 gp8 family phage protein
MTISPIPAGALASAVAAVRAYLRVEGAAEQLVIEQAVAAAIAIGEAFTGCLFVRRSVEERVAATGWAALAGQPVASIEAVLGADGAALSVEAYAVDIDAEARGWVRLTSGSGRVTVRYAAGLAAGWDALDAPLAQGVVLLAAHLYDRRDAGAQPPTAVAALWRPYRRVRLAWPSREAAA